jgi:hypothetical protein
MTTLRPLLVAWLALLSALSASRGHAQPQPAERPVRIVLLGTYHLSGATPDRVKVEGDDVLGARRQAEIDTIVGRLAAFGPQRVFVEGRRPELWAGVLRDYRRGKAPAERWIAANEVFQFGVKLAARLGLPDGVIPVDWQQPDPRDTTARLATRAAEAYRALHRATQESGITEDEWQSPTFRALFPAHLAFMRAVPGLPLREALLAFNADSVRRRLYYFNVLAFMDRDPRGVGAEFALTQQYRNMRIYQNVLRHVDDRTERCLVIYGAGHIEALRGLFAGNPRFEVVEVADVLR